MPDDIPIGFTTSATSLSAEIEKTLKTLGGLDAEWERVHAAFQQQIKESDKLLDDAQGITSPVGATRLTWLWTASTLANLGSLITVLGNQINPFMPVKPTIFRFSS